MKSNYKNIYLLIILITILINTVNARDWYNEFKSKYPNDLQTQPYLAWSESYVIRSYISMYRVAKARNMPLDEQLMWIDRAINHCDYIINNPDLTGKEYLVYAGHGYTPIARLVKIIFKDEMLYSKYQDKANKYLGYMERVVIGNWRNIQGKSDWWNTPINWYLSYGSLLMDLHQITRNPLYRQPFYTTTDTSLAAYYFSNVKDMSENYFNDFGIWKFQDRYWYYPPFSEKKGLCYVDSLDAYTWRYYDHTGTLDFWDIDSAGNVNQVYNDKSIDTNKWYKVVINHSNDSIRMNFYDTDGITLINNNIDKMIINPVDTNFIIGRTIDGFYYFKGAIDDLKIKVNDTLAAYWGFDGNAVDSSGNGFDGIIKGAPEWVEGKIGKALKFSGDDYVIIPKIFKQFNFSSMEFWVKFSEFNKKYYLLGNGTYNGKGGFHLEMNCYERPEDVGHANIDIEFLVKALHDMAFAGAYDNIKIRRFCNTFLNYVWENTDTANPEFFSHVDPSHQYGTHNYEEHTFRWIWLYEFNSKIGQIINNWYENHPNDWYLEAIANLACWQNGLYEDDYDSLSTSIDEKIANKDIYLNISPNPATEQLNIQFFLYNVSNIRIEIFNEFGQIVKPLKEEDINPGLNEITWYCKNELGESIISGVYFIRIYAGSFNRTMSFVYVR